MKTCSKCKIEKPLIDFYKDSRKKDGLRTDCKICSEKRKTIYRQKNLEKIKEGSKKRYLKYFECNSTEILRRNKLWRENNFEIYKESKKKSDLNFLSKNPHYINEYRKNKRDTNPLYKLTCNVRSRLNGFFKKSHTGKINKTIELIGCSPINLRIFLEQKFIEGMSWENQGKWHIDHIVPLSSAKNKEELYKLCHFTNLQPMWATDNIKKGSKII
jgi:hypothetical protein